MNADERLREAEAHAEAAEQAVNDTADAWSRMYDELSERLRKAEAENERLREQRDEDTRTMTTAAAELNAVVDENEQLRAATKTMHVRWHGHQDSDWFQVYVGGSEPENRIFVGHPEDFFAEFHYYARVHGFLTVTEEVIDDDGR
jgi:hypothetical protein